MAHLVSEKRHIEIQISYNFAILGFDFHRFVFVNVGSEKVFGVVVHVRMLAVREIIA